MNEVLLHIVGYRELNGDIEGTEFTTSGMIEQTDDELRIFYDDMKPVDSSTVTTSIIARKDSIIMTKSGAVQTEFVFEPEKTFAASYSTPFGTLDLTLYPTLVDTKESARGGKIELEYVLTFSGLQVMNRLDLSYYKDSEAVQA